RPRHRLLGRKLVLRRRRLELHELKLYLLQEPRLTLRTRAVKLAPQLLDTISAASARALASLASASRRAPRSATIIVCAAARSEGSDSGMSCEDRTHAPPTSKPNHHPTDVGRHASFGYLQSMPHKT